MLEPASRDVGVLYQWASADPQSRISPEGDRSKCAPRRGANRGLGAVSATAMVASLAALVQRPQRVLGAGKIETVSPDVEVEGFNHQLVALANWADMERTAALDPAQNRTVNIVEADLDVIFVDGPVFMENAPLDGVVGSGFEDKLAIIQAQA